MQLFSADATMFLKKKIVPENMNKTTLESGS